MAQDPAAPYKGVTLQDLGKGLGKGLGKLYIELCTPPAILKFLGTGWKAKGLLALDGRETFCFII